MRQQLADVNRNNTQQQVRQLQQQLVGLQVSIQNSSATARERHQLRRQLSCMVATLTELAIELKKTSVVETPPHQLSPDSALRPLHTSHPEIQAHADQILAEPDPELLIRMTRTGIYLDFKAARNFVPIADRDMLVGSSIYSQLPVELADQYLDYIERALNTQEPQVFEFQLEKHDVVSDEEAYIVPIEADEVLMVVRDISKRKRTERELLKSEVTNRALLQTVPDLLIRLSATGIYLDCKPSKLSKVLHSPETPVGKSIYDLMPLDLAQTSMIHVAEALRTGKVQSYEYALQVDDQWHDQEARIAPVGSDEVLMIVRDISDRKRTENALNQANERYRLATAAVNSTIYDWDIAHNHIDRSPGIEAQLGFSPENCEPRAEWWIERIHPEDYPSTYQTIAAALKTSDRYDLEYRVRNRQDDYIYVHDQAIIVRDAAGQAIRVVGNTIDITAYKHAEALLLKSEATNRALVEAIPDLMIRMTKEGKYLDYRYPHEFKTVFFPSEAVGKTVYQALPPDLAQARMALVHKALETGKVQFHEFQLEIEGYLCSEEARISAINEDEVLVIVRDISDRKDAEEALRRSEANLLALVENTTDFIWSVDSDYRLITMNEAFWNCFQKNYHHRLEPGCDILSYVPPEKKHYWQALYDRALAGEQFSVEYQSGDIACDQYLEVSFNPIRNDHTQQIVGVSIFSSDITAHKQAHHILETAKHELEAKVQQRTAELRQTIAQLSQEIQERQRVEIELKLRDRAVAASNNGIVICDAQQPDNPIIYVNPAFETITGYSRAEVLGSNCRFLQGEDTSQATLDILRAALKDGKPSTVTLRNYRKDGSFFWNDLSIAPIYDTEKNLTHFVGIQTDITEVKQSETDIYRALIKERELGELKSRFISMTSHEFRTPLTVILSSASLLENYSHRWDEEKKLTHLQRIQTAGRRMTQLLDDILVLSRAEADKLQYQPKSLNLSQFCQTLVSDLQMSDHDQHLICFSCSESLPPVSMDENLLQQILNNLLSNALKYSNHGCVVEFTVSFDQEMIVFQIQDQGIGIPASDLPYIFDSFHRGNNVGTISGTGLGLTIVQKCVSLQQGTITVTSQENLGTLFVVKLPAIPTDPEYDQNFSH